jgi:hypothetical protein
MKIRGDPVSKLVGPTGFDCGQKFVHHHFRPALGPSLLSCGYGGDVPTEMN